ncbi:hypothetical protein FOS14_10155 [Skermania sp. ID1734]|uniref:hypothetical protein n=1 Tax=Skermania sp. ID1734 TaxID=2597516 RepID=UPI00117D3891|nr:hypothetical protein [Skermania sp. ID1734]TSE00156.1 hypothetical protein FOS14_10155 [Skermania sp. ID1734]
MTADPDDQRSDTSPAVTNSDEQEQSAKLMVMFDRALVAAGDLMDTRISRLRSKHPDASTDQLMKKLERTYLSSVTSTGVATGGAAAVPGVGTAAALAMTAGDASWFMTATVAHVLSALRLYDVEFADLEHQKAIVLTVLAGGGGSTFVGKAAGRTGPHLGKLLTNSVPSSTIRSVNRVLGHNFVTRYGTRQGVLVLGRTAPFGIGAVIGGGGNLLFARGVVSATRKAVETAKAM